MTRPNRDPEAMAESIKEDREQAWRDDYDGRLADGKAADEVFGRDDRDMSWRLDGDPFGGVW